MAVTLIKHSVENEIENSIPQKVVEEIVRNVGYLHKELCKYPPAKLLEIAKNDFQIILAVEKFAKDHGLRCNFISNLRLWYGEDFSSYENDFPMPLNDGQKLYLKMLQGNIYDCFVVLEQEQILALSDRYQQYYAVAAFYAAKNGNYLI